jgi:hypothetical protein
MCELLTSASSGYYADIHDENVAAFWNEFDCSDDDVNSRLYGM